MKKIMGIAIAALLFTQALQAQLPKVAKAGPGKLLTQFANAVKPASFLSSWTGEKTSWLAKAGKVTDAIGIAQSVSSLAGFIKPDMFKSGFNVASLLQTANTVKTITDATGVLKSLEGGLKPEALSTGWNKQRTGWLSALNLLK